MAGIRTSITLVDNVSKTLDRINQKINSVAASFERLNNSQSNLNSSLGSSADRARQLARAVNSVNVNPVAQQTNTVADSLSVANTRANGLAATLARIRSIPLSLSGLRNSLREDIAYANLLNNRLYEIAKMRFRSDVFNLKQDLADSVVRARLLTAGLAAVGKVKLGQELGKFKSTLTTVKQIFKDIGQMNFSQAKANLTSLRPILDSVKEKAMSAGSAILKIYDIRRYPAALKNIASVLTTAVSKSRQLVQTLARPIGSGLNVVSAKLRVITSSMDVLMSKTKLLMNSFFSLGKISLANLQRQIHNLGNGLRQTGNSVTFLIGRLKMLAGMYLGIMGMQNMIGASDAITSSENKFNYVNNGDLKETQQTLDKIYGASQRARTGYTDMMKNVGKSMTLAGKAFDNNMDNAIRFQEIMGKAYTIGGASAAEQSSSMYQMMQGLGSGILQGDELRSVREGASLAYVEIEKFAQGIYDTTESLKDMASEGMITSDIVANAILSAGDKIDKAFKNTKVTFAQMWVLFKNESTKAFEPFLQKLNAIANSDSMKYIATQIMNAIWVIGAAFSWLADKTQVLVDWIAANWNVIKWVILGVVIILVSALIYWMIWAIVAFTLPIIKIILYIGYLLLLVAYYAILISWQIIVAMWNVIMWLVALGPIGLVILAIVAVIMVLMLLGTSFIDICSVIVGAVFWVAATIWNIVVGIVNAVIQFLWTAFVEPWIGIVEWVLNVFNGGFNSFGDGVKNLLGNIISWFLSLGQVVTKIIDAIFGTNWTGGLNALKGKVLAWGKNDKAITLSRDAPTVLNRVSATGAYNTGYNGVQNFGGKINDFASGIKDKVGGFIGGISDGISGGIGGALDKKVGLDPNGANLALDPSLADKLGTGDTGKNTGKTAKNTGDMAATMELTEEDLKYLRQIAEMEAINKFTTAEVKLEVVNNNNIAKGLDANEIITKLSEQLRDELVIVANGVHA